jgi:hypothetical protein
VTVAGRDGQARPLARGAELDTGDTVRTSNEGRAQLRFSDGSYVSLQPNTDFAISDYKFEGKNDDRGFFGLVRGAMRTVTGAVGRVNRNSYRITTPTATVGIRGTGGVIQVLNDGSTLVIGTSGIWSLTNPAGSIDIPAGVSGLAPTEPNTPPKETTTQPQTSPPPVEQKTEFVQGDQVNPDGTAAILPKVLVSGSGFRSAMAFEQYTGPTPTLISQTVDATFDAAGQLTKAVGPSWTNALVSGTNMDFGTDGILAWGRWVGSVQNCPSGATCVIDTYDANEGLHYVIGMPTPVMPTTGTATYSLMGATSPTYADGSTAPGKFSGSLGIDFSSQRVSGAFNVAMPDGKGYAWNGTATASGSQFLMSNSNGSVTPSGGSCPSGCSASVQGFFAGATAERAGIAYHVNDLQLNKNVFGAAAFKKN